MARAPRRRRRHFPNPFAAILGKDDGFVRSSNPTSDLLEALARRGIGRRRRNGGYSDPVTKFLNSGLDFARRAAPMEFDWPVIIGVLLVIMLCTTVISLSVIITRPTREMAKQQVVEATPVMAAVGNQAPSDQIRILLLGSDERGDGSHRTDVIMLVVLDPNDSSIKVVSFPRDLWVKVPSLWEMKINEVDQLGGFEAMAGMFQANFGVQPDYYVMTNFDGFRDFIDNRGGIDVEVAKALTDDCDLVWQRDGDCTVDPGTVHMDGATALWYVRSRQTSSDIDRLRRAQEVVSAVVKKVLNIGAVGQWGQFLAEVEKNVETNMTLDKVIKLLPYAKTAMKDKEKISAYAINEDYASEWISWNGQWILQPDEKAIRQLLIDAGIKLAPK